MKQTHVLLKEARDKGYGIVAPVVFNIESIRRSFVVSDEMLMPIIFRTSSKIMDVSEAVYWVNEFARDYSVENKSLFIDDITTFDEAMEMARMPEIGGISLSDSMGFETKEGMALTKEIARVLKICGISLQVTISEATAKNTDKVKALLAECPVDILKVNFENLTSENAEEKAAIAKELYEKTGVLVAIGDCDLTPEANRVLREGLIAKFDVYESISSKCMDFIEEYIKEDDLKKVAYASWLTFQRKTLDKYYSIIKLRMYDYGYYFIR